LFWVDEDNRFHWTETTNTVTSSFNITVGSTDGVFNHKLNKSTFDVVNFIVWRGGEDLKGNGTLGYHVDEASGTKLSKMRVVAMVDIARNLIEKEIVDGNLVEEVGGTAVFNFNGNRYYRAGAVTPHWTTTSYATDDTYNDALRVKINLDAKKRARSLVRGLSSPRFKGPVEVKGRHIPAGTLINFTDRTVGVVDQKLRVVDVRHTINKNGWFTRYSLEEDEKAIIEGGI